MYVCMCVCVYVCMYVCMYVGMYVCTHISDTCACVYTHTSVCACVRVCIYIYKYSDVFQHPVSSQAQLLDEANNHRQAQVLSAKTL